MGQANPVWLHRATSGYFHQVFFQSAAGYPDTCEIGAGYRF
jgi:hypothetical protein